MQIISKKLIDVIEPYLARIRNAVEQNSLFRIENCGVIRDGPHVFTVGISCEPNNFPLTDVRLSFACVGFTTPDDPESQFTLSVGWHRDMVAGKHAGHSIYEANGGPFKLTDQSDIQNLIAELPRMEAAMLKGLRRGKPPSRLAATINRIFYQCQSPQTYPMPHQ